MATTGGQAPPLLGVQVWPHDLPLPDRDGYGYTTRFGLVRTQFQNGFTRQRRMIWNQPSPLNFRFRMNTAQLGKFHEFLEGPGYTNWFQMELVLGGGFSTEYKRDCMIAAVRFLGDPRVQQIGPNLFRVDIQALIPTMLDPRYDKNTDTKRATVDDVRPEYWDVLNNTDNLTL